MINVHTKRVQLIMIHFFLIFFILTARLFINTALSIIYWGSWSRHWFRQWCAFGVGPSVCPVTSAFNSLVYPFGEEALTIIHCNTHLLNEMAVRFIDIKYSLRISVFLARAETVALVNSKPSYFPVFNFQCLILKLNSNKPHSSAPSLLNINLTVSATFTVLHTSTVPVSFTFTFTVLFWQVLSYQSQIREYFV